MGLKCCKIRFFGRKHSINAKKVNLIFLGLDNAGKTSIVKRLVKEPVEGVLPTIGFAPYHVTRKGCNVTIFDVGGGRSIRDIWSKYYADVHGVVYVVDASDRSRLGECREALRKCLMHPRIAGKPILLFANKQDKADALDELDIVQQLELEGLVNLQKCPTLVELCAAILDKRDVGIENGLNWILWKITKDYPVLNNRVLVDVAQEDESINLSADEEIKPVSVVVQNGNAPSHWLQDSQHDLTVVKNNQSTHSESFFLSHDWSSTTELLDPLPNKKIADFGQRPKSAGVVEFKIKKRKKKKRRIRSNKTGPAPAIDVTYTLKPIPAVFDPSYTTDVTYMNGTVPNELVLNVSNLQS